MAIDVNKVYRTVLLMLNKEQRGYMTPDEFNSIASQVQLDILNGYIEELNQQIRVPANDSEYSDRVKNLDEKLSIFKVKPTALTNIGENSFSIPTDLYRLGTVIYTKDSNTLPVYAEKTNQSDYVSMALVKLAQPTEKYPVYIFENDKIYIYPKTIVSNIKVTYIRKPSDVIWDFTDTENLGYQYNPYNSNDFELHPSEEPAVIKRILLYAGILVRDPQVIQTAMSQVQTEINDERA